MTQTATRATLTITAAGILFTGILASPATAGAIEDQKTRTRALLASRSSVSTEMSARAASLRVDEYTLTTELPSVHFDFASATIRATDRKVLDANAAWLRADPTLLIALEGAADPRGSGDYNLVLGERRAEPYGTSSWPRAWHRGGSRS